MPIELKRTEQPHCSMSECEGRVEYRIRLLDIDGHAPYEDMYSCGDAEDLLQIIHAGLNHMPGRSSARVTRWVP